MRAVRDALLGAAGLALMVTSGVAAQTPAEVREMIHEAAERHGTDVGLLLRIGQCESRLDPSAIGRRGERGVFQWMPGAGNAWRMTSHAQAGVSVTALYAARAPEAVWLDIDGAAEVWARYPQQARREWSCR